MSLESRRLFPSANKLNNKRRGSNGIRAASLATSATFVLGGTVMQKNTSDKNELPKKTSDELVAERQTTGHSNAMGRS
jgi:hypothetical protein